MPTLYVTVGLPGSGKSSEACRYITHHVQPEHGARRVARVNRDALRDQIHPGAYAGQVTEKAVTVAQHTQINALLSEGYDVYCDDTNLRAKHLRALRDLAAVAGAGFEILDFTDVPLEECIRRDALRPTVADNGGRRDGARVGEDVIREMHSRFLSGGRNPTKAEMPVRGEGPKPYIPPVDAPDVIMVDLDGTVALLNGRGPYDETRVSDDLPNQPVIDVVHMSVRSGLRVVFMSGRTDGCRDATEAWLAQHVILPEHRSRFIGLYMRESGDTRPDNVVKLELFDKHVRHAYNVRFVLDDRNQVVKAWRSIGLTVMQVADGAF
jgi:predicted kinase